MEINLDSLNGEQKKAVTHDKGPLLIVAGAGTGKTTVITQRIGYLIESDKVKPDEILALTFTEKAAAEMEERVDKLLPYGYIDLWISTFHAFCEKILQLHALEIGIPNDFKVLDQTNQWMLIKQNLDKFDLDFYKPLGNPTKFIHALIKLFSKAKDEVIRPEDYLKYAQDLKLNLDNSDFIKDVIDLDELKTLTKKEQKEFLAQEVKKAQEVANAYHVYQQLLLENNCLDFGDLINYTLELFKKRPQVLAKYRSKFKYVLVDEFQDTNYAQYELVKLLAHPSNNITVVGDDDQSIYKFRGASVSNILEFKQDYPKASEIFLTKNYRSIQEVLDLSYDFIKQNNPNRLEVKLSDGKKKLSKKLSSELKEKGEVKHFHFATADDEVRGVLEQMNDLKNKDKDSRWSDFAILTRTNDSANVFAAALSKTQIPFQFVASKGLYTKSIVLDVVSYLRLLDDYHESPAVHRVLNSPIVGLEHKSIVQFNYWARRKGYSLFAAVQNMECLNSQPRDVQEKARKFLDLVAKHTALAKEKSASEVIVTFLEDTGYAKYLAQAQTLEDVQNANYLNQFYRKVVEFEKTTDEPSVANLLELLNLELEAGETGSLAKDAQEGPETVKVMTVHAAKGLEFKYVWIVNLVDRRFPTDDRSDAIKIPDSLIKEILPEGDVHIQEERRLFYVAMTRAKNGLYFTSASDYGGSRKKKISKFLAELQDLGFTLDEKASEVAGSILDKVEVLEKNNQDFAYLIPKRFSFSQLNSFSNCPYHYWLEYVLRIPQKGKSFFSFGSTIHNTLQQFFLLVRERADVGQQDLFGAKSSGGNKPLVSEKELLEIYEQKWIDDWYGSRGEHDEYKANGKKMLKEFYKTYQNELTVPKFLETPFTIHVDNATIVGKIDRIDQISDGVEIIDYKTGKAKTKESLDAGDKRQLLIYQLAANQHLGEKVEKLTFYYLEEGARVSVEGSEKEIENLKKWITKTVEEIKNTKFPLKPSDCKCLYKDLRELT